MLARLIFESCAILTSRAASSFVSSYLRLDRHRRPLIKLKCDLCGLHQQFDYEDVLRQFGGDYNMGVLRHKLVRCPHRKLRDSVFAPCQLDYERG